MLNNDNYFSLENQKKYFSVSQFKSFCKCEAAALAEINGDYAREKTPALMVGSYVDAYFEGTLPEFRSAHPEIFTRAGELRSDYRQAEKIIERLKQDKLFMEYMSGKKQVIKTGELFGYPWKIKMDSYHPGKMIVDLKVVKDFEDIWVDGEGKISWIEAWGYDIQGAVYQAIEENQLPFILAAVTKEKVSDLDLIEIGQEHLDVALRIVEARIDRFADIKAGFEEPTRCEKCEYCKATKKLESISKYGGRDE